MRAHSRIALIYAVMGFGWILFSDRLVKFVTSDPEILTTIQDFKGIAFVIVTSLVLYFLMKREFEAREGVKKELEEQRKLTQEYLDNANVVIVVGDTKGQIKLANKKAFSFFECTREQLVDKNIVDAFVDADAAKEIHKSLEKIATGGTHVNYVEVPMITAGGKEMLVAWHNGLVYDEKGNVRFIVASGIDITEKKAIEEELARYRESLERLVQERTNELQKVNRELEAFSYSVSHDLRTPLTIISGYAETLMDNYSEQLGEEGTECLGKMIGASERMSEIIEDLLRLSRINRSEIKKERVNLSLIVRGIDENLEEMNPHRKNTMFISPDNIEAECDKGLATIVLENLLKNSWKFTSKHDNAVIEFGVRKESDQNVYFIKDDGAGFDMSKYDKLFGAFNRLHSTKEFQGTGIGLTIVKRVIQKHGGKIWAQSEPESGAVFSFTFEKLSS